MNTVQVMRFKISCFRHILNLLKLKQFRVMLSVYESKESIHTVFSKPDVKFLDYPESIGLQ